MLEHGRVIDAAGRPRKPRTDADIAPKHRGEVIVATFDELHSWDISSPGVLARLALVDAEAVTFGVGDERAEADRKLVNLGYRHT